MHNNRLYSYMRKKHRMQRALYLALIAGTSLLAAIGFLRPQGYGSLALKTAYYKNKSGQLDKENAKLHKDMENLMPPCMAKAEFTVTAYEKSARSCQKWAKYGRTSSNTVPAIFRTAAVDPKIITKGSLIYVKSIGWLIAEDRGSAIKGRRLDIYLNSVADAVLFGKKKATVYYQSSGCFQKLLNENKYASTLGEEYQYE